MKAALLIIGDEILNGSTLDTNSQYISRALEGINIKVVQRLTIQDREELIVKGLDTCLAVADIVITTGGLGPTKDDITKYTIAKYFNCELVQNDEVLAHVESYFKKKNRPVLDVNKAQAMVPSKAEVIHNAMGTAPGMWIEENGKIVFSMPGVPYEMKYLVDNGLIKKLISRQEHIQINNKYIHTIGVGESFIAKQLEDLETALPSHIRMAYLPSPGIVKLRLTAVGKQGSDLENEITRHWQGMKDRLGDIVFGEKSDTISSAIGALLRERKQTVSTAESCSSGYLAQLITQTPGSSTYYEGSFVTYSYRLKEELLGVDHASLVENGAVSEETIVQMAKGGRERLNSDYCIATSGIAGPDGGMANKPVGTVWIAITSPIGIVAKLWHFGSDRKRNIHLTAVMALDMLRRVILDLPIK